MQIVYVSLIAISMVLVLGITFSAFDAADQESKMVEAELEQARRQSAALQGRVDAIRRWRHDIEGLLQAMEHSLGARVLEDASGSIARTSLPEEIVAFKQHQCSRQGIAFAVDACEGWAGALRSVGVEEADAAALLQNLLENAYEENMRIADESRRSMALAVTRRTDGEVRIEVRNSIDPAQHAGFLSRKSTSELHGVGLRIVDGIVEAHHGTKSVEIDHDAGTLTSIVRFVPAG